MTNKTLKHLITAFIALGFLDVVSDSIAAYRKAIEGNIPMMIFNFVFIFINAALVCFYVKVHAKIVEEEQNHEWVKERQNKQRLEKTIKAMSDDSFDEMIAELKSLHEFAKGKR